MSALHHEVLKTLLYYDIWSHPLTSTELFAFLGVNSMTLHDFRNRLLDLTERGSIGRQGDYFFLREQSEGVVLRRKEKERHARRLWVMARIAAHIIKRCPFVRAILVSGDLSKNVADVHSDVDLFIITEPNRLWITRALLTIFKKTFLFNSKKFFCLNYFVSTDNLRHVEQNIFVATEIAHLKPLFNDRLFRAYLKENDWIRMFFPNFSSEYVSPYPVSNRRSLLQGLAEMFFHLLPADRLDSFLMRSMQTIWKHRYPRFSEEERERIFRSTKKESRAYVGDFEQKILTLYSHRLSEYGLKE
jgi:hypothetical protein